MCQDEPTMTCTPPLPCTTHSRRNAIGLIYVSIIFPSDAKSAPCTVSEQAGDKPEDSASNVDTGYDTNSIASSSQISKVLRYMEEMMVIFTFANF